MDTRFQFFCFPRLSPLSIFIVFLCLIGCATKQYDSSKTSSQTAKPITLAVWDFDNNSPPGGELDYLGKTLAEELVTHLTSSPNIKLVEREQLRKILEEQHLSASQLTSDETRLKLGHLAGANHMVFGSYVAVGNQIRLDVRVVDVETSLTEFSESQIFITSETSLVIQEVGNKIVNKFKGFNLRS